MINTRAGNGITAAGAPGPIPSARRPSRPRLVAFGCGRVEADLFQSLAPSLGVLPKIITSPVSEHTAELARGVGCISVDHRTRVSHSTLRELRRVGVRYISTRSIGIDHLDAEYARRIGVQVANVSYSPDSVADYTVMLILMVLRGAKSMVGRVDDHDYRLSEVRGRELRDLTVGIVGTGRIGAAVIARLRGFGCRILAYDIRPKITADYLPFDELLRCSDVLSLHTPLTPESRHLLDRRAIGRLPAGAVVINTGRGGLVDTEALEDALRRGDLVGAALDVVEGEEGRFYTDCRDRPAEHDAVSRLQRLPNVIISPHVAYDTDHSARDMVEQSIINCRNFESESQHV